MIQLMHKFVFHLYIFQAWWKFAATSAVVHSWCRVRPYSDVWSWGAAVSEALQRGSEPAWAADWSECLSAWIPWSMVRPTCIESWFSSQAANAGAAPRVLFFYADNLTILIMLLHEEPAYQKLVCNTVHHLIHLYYYRTCCTCWNKRHFPIPFDR